MMTTLFSIFAPIFLSLKLKSSLLILMLITIMFWYILLLQILSSNEALMSIFSEKIFNLSQMSLLLFMIFISLACLNLLSFMLYSYPITTTLSFNLAAALSCWLTSTMILLMKKKSINSLLPTNTPWYLIPFLCVVELISILVRPVTLCFRLLANMVAGHILLALIAKLPYLWAVGSLFGVLEIMVAVVQAFVFSMLVSVYLDEVFSH